MIVADLPKDRPGREIAKIAESMLESRFKQAGLDGWKFIVGEDHEIPIVHVMAVDGVRYIVKPLTLESVLEARGDSEIEDLLDQHIEIVVHGAKVASGGG